MMHTILKKLTSLVLVAFMVLSMVPIVAVTANAAEGVQTYEKITSAPDDWSGTYLIVYEDGKVAFDGSLTTLDAISNTVSVTITDGKITGNFFANTFTIEKSGNSYTIMSKSGYYIGQTSNSNGLKSSTSNTYANTISSNEDGTVNVVSGGAFLRYNANSDQTRFRYFKSATYTSQKAITLYKLVENTSDCKHEKTTTTTVDATCTTDGSVTVTCDDCGAITSTTPIPATGHTEVIDEAKAATCTETGLTEGKHCSVCNEVLVAQTVVPMVAHNYENGACTVCSKKQPTGFTINRDSFGEASKYAWHAWTAATTTDEKFSGYGYIFGDTKDSIQVNANQTGNFIYNETPLPGSITSVTLTAYKATFRNFYVVTSPEPFNNETNKLNPTDVEAKKVTTSGATWKFTTTDRYFAIVVTGGAAYLSSIEITYEACSHENTENVDAVPATCTDAGYTAGKYCNDCQTYISGHEEIAALGHNWLGWTETVVATCTATGEQTGTCSRCDATKTVEIPTTDHTYVDGTCSVCGATKTETSNRYYIATKRASGNYFYMTNDLGTADPERYQAVDSGLTKLHDKIFNPEANKVFVLVDNGDETYSIYADGVTGNNYLGHSGTSNSGLLVAEENALKVTVDVTNSIYNIHYQASDAERYLSLNSQSENNYFAWYKTGQAKDLVLIPVGETNPIVKWNITLEDNLKVNFHLELNEGEQVYLKVGSEEVAYNLSDLTKTAEGYYVATVSMAAAQMTDDINVQVINLTNEKLLANKTYSIRGYADAVLGSEKYPETTKTLVNEMLNYGGAAQAFFGYNTGNPANAGITGAGATPVPVSVASDMNKENDSDGCITFYGASLVYRDKIAVRYYFDAKEGQDLTFVADGQEREPVMTGGHYMIEVPDICPQDYATQITVTVTNAEGHSATVSYGPMNYIVRMYYKEGATTEMQNLLQALYNYHLAAVAYIAAQNP